MKSTTFKSLALGIIFCFIYCSPVFSAPDITGSQFSDRNRTRENNKGSGGFTYNNFEAANVGKPTAKNLEKALMKYVLSYEALQKAKTTPSQQSKVPAYKKNYDEAYSKYLQLLYAAELYDPSDEEKVNNPAGEYNEKAKSKGKKAQKWKTVDTSKYREKVAAAVEEGKEPEQVVQVVDKQIKKKGYSKAEGSCDTNTGDDPDPEETDPEEDDGIPIDEEEECQHTNIESQPTGETVCVDCGATLNF